MDNQITFLLSFFLVFIVLIAILGVLSFILWIWMIIDCAQRKFKNDSERVVWILVIIFLHILGAAIYYFAVKLKGREK